MKLTESSIRERLRTNLGLDATASKIVVVGLGITGISVANYLHGLGYEFSIVDSREQPSGLQELLTKIGPKQVVCGKFDDSVLMGATHLVVSPGLSLQEPAIKLAMDSGVKILGDIDLFACSTDAPIVAITGSNGKSTVTTMVGDMAKAAGIKTGVGGNLGRAALDLLTDEADLYVLELSSFQLERTTQLNAKVATVLNVSADHLDRHVDLADYAQQKQRIFRGGGIRVLNLDDPVVAGMQDSESEVLTFSIRQQADFYLAEHQGSEYLTQGDEHLMPVAELPLEGRHNAANALAALALGMAIGLDKSAMLKALREFKGLSHRMQRVAEHAGVLWVNDSKATNIGACVAALQGSDRNVVLLAGGDAKGADMAELVPAVRDKANHVILMGKDADLIAQAIADAVPVSRAANMKEAVTLAGRLAKPGDCVLLSPACASLDQYKDYRDRGNQFVDAVLSFIKDVPETSNQALGV